jgi:hypothetical protein
MYILRNFQEMLIRLREAAWCPRPEAVIPRVLDLNKFKLLSKAFQTALRQF